MPIATRYLTMRECRSSVGEGGRDVIVFEAFTGHTSMSGEGGRTTDGCRMDLGDQTSEGSSRS
ncbi:hypothetical protein ASG05_00860 [Frigoribacterium sp. Leaf186]|nr:hypothetical protein ASG05_00860 [Frigoribacterium sp. Leaf186]